MIDLGKEKDRNNLNKVMGVSWTSLKPFRQRRLNAIKHYRGSEWGDGDRDVKEMLVNNVLLTAQAYMMSLAGNRPRVLVRAKTQNLLPFAAVFQANINNLLEEIRFERTLQQIVLDAYFSMGISKTYWAEGRAIERPNPDMPQEPGMGASDDQWSQYEEQQRTIPATIWVDPGTPYVERVSLDDYGFDTAATEFSRQRFQWHSYRVPLVDIKADERFNKKYTKEMKGDSRSTSVMFGTQEEKARHQTGPKDRDEVESSCELIDLYLPFERKWAVMAQSGTDFVPLYVADWNGPEGGPFRTLTFDDVPDEGMPVSPVSSIMGLQNLQNSLLRKQAEQARRQKTFTVYNGDEQDALAVKKASDGEIVKVAHPDQVKEMRYGGVDQSNLAFSQIIDGQLSRQAGNLDAKAGLGPQSGTAKQDAMIRGAVSNQESKMRDRVLRFVSDVAGDLGWMMWIDEALEMETSIKEPGLELPIQAKWSPEQREGDFAQYGFDIDPISMPYVSPGEKVEQLNGAIQQLAPLVQMGGAIIDVPELVKQYSTLLNLPELENIIKLAPPMPQEPQQGGNGPQGPKPPNESIRTNVSTAGTPDAQRVQMSQALLSASGDNNQ